MFRIDVSRREPLNTFFVSSVPDAAGVYIIYDLAGPIYVGRSRVDIRKRLQRHLHGTGNINIALARRLGAGASLSFTYCCLPAAEQANVESLLIAALGAGNFANLRREGLYEDDL